MAENKVISKYSELTKNQKRILNLLYVFNGEYWIQKDEYIPNKQGFLWKMHYYDDTDKFKVNNWSVNALINKGWLIVVTDYYCNIMHNPVYAKLTEEAKTKLCMIKLGIDKD